MKKSFIIIATIAIILSSYTYGFATALNINAEAALLMDYDTMEILYEKNMDAKLFPASTTKIMTAILALEHGNMNDLVTVDQEVVDLTKGSHIALEPGEQLTLEQLMYALMLPSANDAALAIGKHISGSIDGFVSMMNEKAKSIGAVNTNYVNPNGLHNDNHYSTAYDLALIGHYAMENPEFRKFANRVDYTIEPTNIKTEPRYLRITNKLLYSNETIYVDEKYIPAKYSGASGVKTGYTPEAGNCLVSFAEKDGQRLLAVVLKSTINKVYPDTHQLLNYGFNNFSNTILCYKNEFIDNFQIENGELPYVPGVIKDDLAFPIMANSSMDIDKRVNLNEGLTAPIQKDQVIGSVEYIKDGKPIASASIVSTMDIEVDPRSNILYRILSKWYLILFILFILYRINVVSRRKKRRSRRKAYSIYNIKSPGQWWPGDFIIILL